MEKEIITKMLLISTSSQPINPLTLRTMITDKVGHFNCEIERNTATIDYKGKLSDEHKKILDKLADDNGCVIAYIEAYTDDERLSYNTICLL